MRKMGALVLCRRSGPRRQGAYSGTRKFQKAPSLHMPPLCRSRLWERTGLGNDGRVTFARKSWLDSARADWLALLDAHRHTESRPKRDQRPRVGVVSRLEVKAVRLGQRRQRQLRFDQRELVADALPRTGAERDVHELRTLGDALGRKTFGVECVGVRPVRRMPMQHVRD